MAVQTTIIVPTRLTRGDWLAQCLDSIQTQSVDCNIVLVSPRRPPALSTSARTIWVQDRGAGLGAAVNSGFLEVDTPLVKWLGDDDMLSDGSIQASEQQLARSPAAPFAYGQCRIIDRGDRLGTVRPGRLAVPLLRYKRQLLAQPGSLLRTEAVRAVGCLDSALRNCMDADLFLRLLHMGSPVYIARVHAAFRIHPNSLTSTNSDGGSEAQMVRDRYLTDRQRRVVRVADPLLNMAGKVMARLQMSDPRIDSATFAGDAL